MQGGEQVGPPGVGWWALSGGAGRRGAGGGRADKAIGGDAGFELDGLADGACEAGEGQSVVRDFGGGGGVGVRLGCGGGLDGRGRGLGRRVRVGGGPVLAGAGGGAFGHVHAEFDQAGAVAQMARLAFGLFGV